MRAALERIARRSESVSERLQRVTVYLLNSSQHDMDIMLHDIRHELSTEAQATLATLFQTGIVAPITSIFTAGMEEGILRDQAHGGADAIIAAYLLLSMMARLPNREGSGERAVNPANPARAAYSIIFAGDEQRASMIVRILLHGMAYPGQEENGQQETTAR